MLLARKCAKCGMSVGDLAATACPVCGGNLTVSTSRPVVWIGAIVQFAVMSTFMLVFHFPKVMILFFGAFLLFGIVLSEVIKKKQIPARPAPQIQLSRPILYRVLSAFIALGSITCFAILLFGFVMFTNDWSRYQTYQGQPYHRADFVVMQTYFQRGSKGSVDVYASGMVEGHKEWMSLAPYLHARPHDIGELEEHVPPGTSIPIYLFPNLKGRMRVEVYSDTPIAERYHQGAMKVLNKAPLAFVLVGGILFLLIRLRRSCVREDESAAALANPQVEIGRSC